MSEYFDIKRLTKIAELQRDHAYCPYSEQAIGVVIQAETPQGPKRSVGANIENSAYGSTVCAERIAVWQAVYHGYAKYAAVLVISSNFSPPKAPCGECCQVITEHLPPDCKIIAINLQGVQRKWKVKDLLQDSFGKYHNLRGRRG